MTDKTAKSQSHLSRIFKQWRRNRRAVAGAFILTAIILLAVFAPYVTKHEPHDRTCAIASSLL